MMAKSSYRAQLSEEEHFQADSTLLQERIRELGERMKALCGKNGTGGCGEIVPIVCYDSRVMRRLK